MSAHRAAFILAAVLFLTIALAQPALATTLPSGFTETTFASGIANPTAMQFAPDDRLFVAEQAGRLRVIKNGQLLSAPFVTLSVNTISERGLLGIAFDPAFAANQYLYLYYTTASDPIRNRVSRFTANADVAQAGSEVILMNLPPVSAGNHNGGAMHFGSDGLLYVATGENANTALSQDMNSPYGKMLRIDPRRHNAGDVNAIFPTDNPFWQAASSTTTPQWRNAIWALGFRNPFTFDVQPGTGLIYINDVGSSGGSRREEINQGARGANYGWPNTEGTGSGSFTGPVYAYGGSTGAISGCAITGGAFYNPAVAAFPADYIGDYFFADYCGSWIARWDITARTASLFATSISGSTVDLKVGPDGALYYLSRGDRAVMRISSNTPPPTPRPNQPPTGSITSPANGGRYTAGDRISFSGAATDPEDGALPASAYEWEVVFHHDEHTHPFLLPTAGQTSGAFTIPRDGHTETTVWYRIILRVTDSGGLRHESVVDLFPNVVTLTLESSPPGLQITVDGQPRTTPHTFDAVVGMQRAIGAPSPQVLNGRTYTFASWSDGGAQTHTLTVPAAAAAYTAAFTVLVGDLDGDGAVTLQDFALLAASYNRAAGQPGYDARADLNADGAVTLQDFALLAANFNRTG